MMKQPGKAELSGVGAAKSLVLYRIILYVRDVQKLAEFYRDTLGLSVVGEIVVEQIVVEEIKDSWVGLKISHCELGASPRRGSVSRIEWKFLRAA